MATLDSLLKNFPTCRPPYLTGRGILWVGATIAVCIGSVIAQGLEMTDLALLGMSMSAFSTFLLGWIYAAQLRVWRAIRNGRFEIMPEPFHKLGRVDDEITIRCRLRNRLSTNVHILAMHWHHSPHLEMTTAFHVPLDNSMDECFTEATLARKSETVFIFQGRTTTIGCGAVYGAGILCADNWGIVRSESHIECQLDVAVLPSCPSITSRTSSEYWLDEQLSQAARHAGDGELDAVRPWTNKDTIRRIAWRGFARHQELSVWYRTRNDRKQLVCLVDAGQHAVATGKTPPCTSALSETLVTLARFVCDFESVTILAYSDQRCEQVADALAPTRAIRAYEDWFLSTISWQPPPKPDDERWSEAAAKLWSDFRLYKHVDFSTMDRDGRKIDLQGLVNWARADKLTAAQAQNDQIAFQHCLYQSYDALLLELLRNRFHPCGHALLPQASPPCLRLALPMLKGAFQSDEATVLAWFSPFSTPYSADELQTLEDLILRQNVRAYGICMPMPTESMNFLQPQGRRCMENTMMRMQRAVTFMP